MSNGLAFVNITIHFQELHYHQWYHPLNQSGCWTMMNSTFLKQSPVTVNMILRSSFVTLLSSRELKGKRPSSFCHRQDEGKTGANSNKHTLYKDFADLSLATCYFWEGSIALALTVVHHILIPYLTQNVSICLLTTRIISTTWLNEILRMLSTMLRTNYIWTKKC